MKHSTLLTTAALCGFTLFAFSGCETSTTSTEGTYSSSGENVFINQESQSMGQVVNNGAAQSGYGLSKASATASDSDTLTGDIVIVKLHFDDTCNCFVRTANFTTSVGFERVRQDSIWLIDSSGDTLNVFRPGHAKTLVHHRTVTRMNGTTGNAINVQFNTTMTWTSGDTAAVWNGTITGTFNGVTFKNCTITNVERPVMTIFGFKYFGFPESGTITFTEGNFSVVVQFTGSGTARVTITNTTTSKVFILHIDVTGKES